MRFPFFFIYVRNPGYLPFLTSFSRNLVREGNSYSISFEWFEIENIKMNR